MPSSKAAGRTPRRTNSSAYGFLTLKYFAGPLIEFVDGLAVPTAVQLAALPSAVLDHRVPPVGAQEMMMLPADTVNDSLAGVFGGDQTYFGL